MRVTGRGRIDRSRTLRFSFDGRALLGHPGDTLASIAFQEYKDPNKWRALAESNNIDDPMRLKEGTVLIVPGRREAEALS